MTQGFSTETFPEPNWITRKIAVFVLLGEYKVPKAPLLDFLFGKSHKGIVELPRGLKNKRGLKFLVERDYVRRLGLRKVIVLRSIWES